MKKVKVENYKKPNYSTLKMVTGKILPAGLVIATIITNAPNSHIEANETPKANYSTNEKGDFPAIAGGVPYPTITTEKRPITVLVNKAIIEFDVEPVWENGSVLVPLRKIFETLGANVTWDDDTQTATAIKGKDTIVLAVNESKVLKNGIEITLDVATKMVDDRLLVPVKVISEGLGCDVSWNEIDNQVVIDCNEEQSIYMTVGEVPIVEN